MKEARHQRSHIILIHLDELVDKSIEIEIRLVIARISPGGGSSED